MANPESVSLGSLAPGEAARGSLTLRNSGSEPMVVDRVKTSCPCVRVSTVPCAVPANGESKLTWDYDPNEDPKFRGGLLVELTGLGAGETVLFQARLHVEIREKE